MLVALLLLQTFAAPDSEAVHRRALSAQAVFERTRRQLLPISHTGFRCDTRVGRFCYWYDPGEPLPPEEPERIGDAREHLLAELAEAAGRLPGDGWIAAQRVKYLVEHGRHAEAADAARACAAESWWCAALEGYAHHTAGDPVRAGRAYDAALAAMRADARCRWLDLTPLLEDREARVYRQHACEVRPTVNAGLLEPRRPLLTVPGNALWTEILARHTFIRMQEGAWTHHGSRMSGDLGEMVLRYGWATAWSRRLEGSAASSDVSVIGHEPRPAWPWLVPPGTGATVAWPPAAEHPRARFALPGVAGMVPLGAVQWARFARGDSILVVAAFAAIPDTLFRGDSVRAALAVLADDVDPGRPRRTPDGIGVVTALAPAGATLASVEVEDVAARYWAVARTRLPGDGTPPAISDLLVIRAADAEPAVLEDALPRALSDLRLRERRVALYWESAWPRPDLQAATIRLEVVPGRPGFLGRVGRVLGVARSRPPIALAWERVLPAGSGPVGHTVELDLGRLAPGRYQIVVEMRTEGGPPWTSERTVELVRP